MRRLVSVLACIAVLALAASASATPPASETITVDETFVERNLCDFKVVIHVEGRIKITTHVDSEGNLVFESATPNFHITVTNPKNGLSFRDADVGLDKFVANPDGSGFVLSTGIHFRVVGETGGLIFARIGLQIIRVDSKGNETLEIIGGNFDPIEDFPEVACAYLAG